MKFKCFITLIIAAALVTCGSDAFGFLGATPEQCERTYGHKKLEKQLGNETVRIYEPSPREYGGAFVVASFQNGLATSVRYQIRNKKAFTPEEFALFASLNTPKGTRFNEVGVSIDKRKKIWARADSTAYIVVDANEATLDIVAYEWLINYAQKLGLKLPQGIAFPTPPSQNAMDGKEVRRAIPVDKRSPGMPVQDLSPTPVPLPVQHVTPTPVPVARSGR
jgi:hypothetical protein